jgi:hypothetical protein
MSNMSSKSPDTSALQALGQDLDASVRQQANYQLTREQQLDARFTIVNAPFASMDTRFDTGEARLESQWQDMDASFGQVVTYQMQTEQQLDARFASVDARLERVKANMAPKDDLIKTEARILSAIKQSFLRFAPSFSLPQGIDRSSPCHRTRRCKASPLFLIWAKSYPLSDMRNGTPAIQAPCMCHS